MVIVLGSVVVREGMFAEAMALSRQHVDRSRQEPGCIAHAVHRDEENPLRLVFVEQWADREALAAHFLVPESRGFARALSALAAAAPELRVFEASTIQVQGSKKPA